MPLSYHALAKALEAVIARLVRTYPLVTMPLSYHALVKALEAVIARLVRTP